MATYESFNDKKRKLPSLWNKLNKAEDDVANLGKIVINLNDVSFTKNIFRQTLLDNVLLSSNGSGGIKTVTIDFPVLPSWAIPMVHIVTTGYLADAYHPDDTSITLNTTKHWIELGENHYELHLRIVGDAAGAEDFPAFYINVELFMINENDYFVTQSEGE